MLFFGKSRRFIDGEFTIGNDASLSNAKGFVSDGAVTQIEPDVINLFFGLDDTIGSELNVINGQEYTLSGNVTQMTTGATAQVGIHLDQATLGIILLTNLGEFSFNFTSTADRVRLLIGSNGGGSWNFKDLRVDKV